MSTTPRSVKTPHEAFPSRRYVSSFTFVSLQEFRNYGFGAYCTILLRGAQVPYRVVMHGRSDKEWAWIVVVAHKMGVCGRKKAVVQHVARRMRGLTNMALAGPKMRVCCSQDQVVAVFVSSGNRPQSDGTGAGERSLECDGTRRGPQ